MFAPRERIYWYRIERYIMVSRHFLILGLDGLRMDMVTPELTPNLLRLASRGVFFKQHHAEFPTATRVNVASLVTGAHSGTHGVVNNSIFDPGIAADKPVDLGKFDVVEAADAHYGGNLFGTPSLGEILAAHDQSMMAISSGTTGSNRLMHHKVKPFGGVVFSAHGLAPCYPTSDAESILARFGAVPEAGTPDQARLAYITDVFIEHLFPLYQPRVTILWFSDPDKTYHYCGIGAPESLQSIQAADRCLGRIMEWVQHPSQEGRITLIVLSDHGQISIRQQLSVRHALEDIGVKAGHGCYGDGNVAVVPWSNGSIHLRNDHPELVQKIVEWMQHQPWCGSLFTTGKNAVEGIVPGTFARSLVGNDHPRSGDIVYVLRADDQPDAQGITGGCYDDSQLSVGGGTHGGLTEQELHNVCVAYGPDFKVGYESSIPSGTIDVMPTILHLLGYAIPSTVDGRVLSEALVRSGIEVGLAPTTSTYSTEASGPYTQHLTVTRVGATTYIDHGWVE